MPKLKREDYSDEAEMEQVRQIAEEIFGVKFDRVIRSGAEANFVGIRSEEVLFSRRLDSRTYFIQDVRYGVDREAGVFRGSDKEHFKVCRDILKRLRIPLSEIEKEVVLKEQTQVAQVDPESKNISMEGVQEGKYFAELSRKIEGIPVWSSSFLLGLTKEKQIGFMELHWPEIPKHVVLEAHRLEHQIKQGWHPPEQPGATVEAVESGIIHSPAIGFVLDIYPAIRVIYVANEERFGSKPVRYLDRHGKTVPIPRQAELPVEPTQQREPPEREKR